METAIRVATSIKIDVADAILRAVRAKWPAFTLQDTREVLARVNAIKAGQLHTLFYFKRESKKNLADFCKVTRYRVQFCDYEALSVIKELRAGGVAANNPAVKNEQHVPTEGGAKVLFVNEETGKCKVRCPVYFPAKKDDEDKIQETLYFIGEKVVSKQEYYAEWQARGYALPSANTNSQPADFRSLEVSGKMARVLCLH